MNVLGFLLEKEVNQLRRNPIFLGILVLFTTLVLMIFPYAINYDLKHLSISIVNTDSSPYSQQLIGKIQANPIFRIQEIHTTFDAAINDIEAHKSLAIIVIPKDFSENLTNENSSTLNVMVNSIDGIQASIATNYIQEIVKEYSQELLLESTGQATISPLEIKPLYKYNNTLNYRFFMLPALIVVMITMYCGIFPAIMLVQEKEIGTLQQINVTPVRPITFILSKIIPYWVIAQVILLLAVSIIHYFHHLPLSGSYFLLALGVLAFSGVMSSLGVIISNFSDTLQQAMFILLFFVLIFFLISGLFTPVNAMPVWAKAIAYSNPLTYFNEIVRMLYLKGSSFKDILPKLLALLLFQVIFGSIAVVTHKKREK